MGKKGGKFVERRKRRKLQSANCKRGALLGEEDDFFDKGVWGRGGLLNIIIVFH